MDRILTRFEDGPGWFTAVRCLYVSTIVSCTVINKVNMEPLLSQQIVFIDSPHADTVNYAASWRTLSTNWFGFVLSRVCLCSGTQMHHRFTPNLSWVWQTIALIFRVFFLVFFQFVSSGPWLALEGCLLWILVIEGTALSGTLMSSWTLHRLDSVDKRTRDCGS